MNIRHLETFVAFMATRSTTVAATQLGASQSTVSRALAQFEHTLALPLFVRRKGQLLPTREAESLLDDVQSLLSDRQAFQRRIAQLRQGARPRTRLRVHVPATLGSRLMPAVTAALARSHPHLVLEVQAGDGRQAESALLARETDLAVLRLPARHPRLLAAPLFETRPACVLPARHPLGRKAVIDMRDLAGAGLILPGKPRRLRRDLDELFRAAALQPRICAEYHHADMACRMAAEGLGVALVNALLANLCLPANAVLRPLASAHPYGFGLAQPPGEPPSPAILALRAALDHCLAPWIGTRGW